MTQSLNTLDDCTNQTLKAVIKHIEALSKASNNKSMALLNLNRFFALLIMEQKSQKIQKVSDFNKLTYLQYAQIELMEIFNKLFCTAV